MPSYESMRTLNGAGSLVHMVILLFIGVTLLHRGYGEREQWVHMVPGRVVFGCFLTLTALISIESAIAKIWFRSTGPGGVGKYINTWYINLALVVVILLGIWTMVRHHKNTLANRGVGSPVEERTIEALERTASATEKIAEHIP